MSRTVQRIIGGMRSHDASTRRAASRGADSRFMRAHNYLLVLDCVRDVGPIARANISRRTGLSRTTVGAIIDSLLADGLVREGETESTTSAGGRPGTLVHFNACAGYVIGVDMGRSHLTILLSDLASQPVARRSGPFSTDRGPDICLGLIVAELDSFIREQDIAWSQVVGLCVGIPGPLDARVHKLTSPPRMPGWHGVEVQRTLRRKLSVPVYVENDANLGALGESRYGAGRGVSDLAYIKIGTGIGGGLLIDGQVYHGSAGGAGEIGHVAIEADGSLCSCGNRGCLEAVAGADAIVADARMIAAVHGGVPHATSATSAFSGLAHPDIADVVQAALEGDPACRLAIEHAGDHIGAALAILVNLINPSLILVEGAVTCAGDLLLGPVRRAVASRSLAVGSCHTRIAGGELRDNAIAMGGVATVLDAAFAPSSGATNRTGLRGNRRTAIARGADEQVALYTEFAPLISERQRARHLH
jgi:predicted NBD/HSP70 family sugar kinase